MIQPSKNGVQQSVWTLLQAYVVPPTPPSPPPGPTDDRRSHDAASRSSTVDDGRTATDRPAHDVSVEAVA